MAYFQQRPENGEYTRQFASARLEAQEEEWEEEEEEYDDRDGFDELDGDEELEEIPPEELEREKRRRYRIAAGVGDYAAIVAGLIVILALLAFLINMVRFVISDFSQNIPLWQSNL